MLSQDRHLTLIKTFFSSQVFTDQNSVRYFDFDTSLLLQLKILQTCFIYFTRIFKQCA